MIAFNVSTLRIATALALVTTGLAAHATNGINLIGFGAESTLMGGADVAVARDTSALNTNPAGLTQIKAPLLDMFGSVLRTTDLVHKDPRNEEHASNRYTLLGGGGYARPLENMPCTAGIGLFAQGGAGGVFDNLRTPFGNRDDLSSLFGIAKIIPGIGCEVTDKLSLGASLNIVYASIEQDFFANTSVNAVPFAGYKLEGASAVRTGFKLGMQYRVTPALTLAASYTEKTELPMTGGTLTADFTDAGLGKVKYADASIKGFALPREVAVGMAFKPTDDWLLSFKLNWLNWGDAINDVTLRATKPNNASAQSIYGSSMAADWKDQWVVATGVAYNWDNRTTLYAGHNYGKNPIPRQNSSPLLAGTLEHHLTFGAARKIDPHWLMTGGVEWMLPVSVKYNSQLFGESEIRNEAIVLHFMLSRRW
ncbi:OmpP1/FadL family transporter [Methylophilus sp. UBA6697]|uniref:OmpP1/FadL family transporter n=1 Tax=Methylophilus sp. UBA6697 TaxID=1946902 RepID=UPI000EEADD03|nr:outer membrane protein transport protein [Methylophilus sp. UBA6697]HCU84567.1 aromatic hydrocarbon degradation protein [Methylophilus sp.]